MNVSTQDNMRPLTPQVFHILLALSRRSLHGYGLRQEVRIDSRGLVQIGSGSMSNTLRRLTEWGWIESQDRLGDYGKETRQQYYALTSVGRAMCTAEIERYRHIVELADIKKTAPVKGLFFEGFRPDGGGSRYRCRERRPRRPAG